MLRQEMLQQLMESMNKHLVTMREVGTMLTLMKSLQAKKQVLLV